MKNFSYFASVFVLASVPVAAAEIVSVWLWLHYPAILGAIGTAAIFTAASYLALRLTWSLPAPKVSE